jgi:hypothetical protein
MRFGLSASVCTSVIRPGVVSMLPLCKQGLNKSNYWTIDGQHTGGYNVAVADRDLVQRLLGLLDDQNFEGVAALLTPTCDLKHPAASVQARAKRQRFFVAP